MSADGFQNNGIVKITESIELTDIACPWLDTKLEGSRKHLCFLKDKHRAEIWSEVNFLGVALGFRSRKPRQREIYALLKLRCTKLGAGNKIYECSIFKIFFSEKSYKGAETWTA